MDTVQAAKRQSKFHNETFVPTIKKALEENRVPKQLRDDLVEAVRIAGTVGPSSRYGNQMMAEVLFVILAGFLEPEPVTKPKSVTKSKPK